jgi:hypothetical protein
MFYLFPGSVICQFVNHVVFPQARSGCHCLFIQLNSSLLEHQSIPIFTIDTINFVTWFKLVSDTVIFTTKDILIRLRRKRDKSYEDLLLVALL